MFVILDSFANPYIVVDATTEVDMISAMLPELHIKEYNDIPYRPPRKLHDSFVRAAINE